MIYMRKFLYLYPKELAARSPMEKGIVYYGETGDYKLRSSFYYDCFAFDDQII